MPESKKSGVEWKMVGLNVLGMVACYLLLQMFNALLIATLCFSPPESS